MRAARLVFNNGSNNVLYAFLAVPPHKGNNAIMAAILIMELVMAMIGCAVDGGASKKAIDAADNGTDDAHLCMAFKCGTYK